MLGLIKGIMAESYDILDQEVDEQYGIPIFYDDESMYEYLERDE